MNKLGVGFVGSDVHVGGYVKAFMAHPQVRLIGACDGEDDSAREVAVQGNMGLWTTCYEELLENPVIDVIMVCSADHFHASHSIEALRAGKHVLCEKPMTTTLQDCKDMVRAVDETGLTFMASQFMRFLPIHQEIKKLYDEGMLGRAFFVEGSYIHDMSGIYAQRTWRSDPKNPQNVLIGGGCHPLDLLRWAVGSEIEEVHAYSNGYATRDFVLDDCYIFSCKFGKRLSRKSDGNCGLQRTRYGRGLPFNLRDRSDRMARLLLSRQRGANSDYFQEAGSDANGCESFCGLCNDRKATVHRCPRRGENRVGTGCRCGIRRIGNTGFCL